MTATRTVSGLGPGGWRASLRAQPWLALRLGTSLFVIIQTHGRGRSQLAGVHRKLRLGFMVEALTFDESIGIAASAVVQRAVYPSGRFATAAWNLVSHNVCFLGAKI